MALFPHIQLVFCVILFSSTFDFAVAVAFAFALVAVFALAFAVAHDVVFAAAFVVAFSVAFAFAFAFALVYVIHVPWICFSEVVHDPRLIRVQVGLDDRPQLVVVALKVESSPADGLKVFVRSHEAPR